MNQAYDRLYSDKVSKFAIFGPISNFARSLQATPLKYLAKHYYSLGPINDRILHGKDNKPEKH